MILGRGFKSTDVIVNNSVKLIIEYKNMLKNIVNISLLVMTSSICMAGEAYDSDSNKNMLYIGAGSSSAYDMSASVIGYMRKRQDSTFSLGIDISQESKMHDTTYSQDTYTSALSYNFIIANRFYESSDIAFDLGLLAGSRETSRGCAQQSYLGYACYADESPTTDNAFNYGGIMYVSYKEVTLGFRLTEVSSQIFIGMRY